MKIPLHGSPNFQELLSEGLKVYPGGRQQATMLILTLQLFSLGEWLNNLLLASYFFLVFIKSKFCITKADRYFPAGISEYH
jgi:hypothetical protein